MDSSSLYCVAGSIDYQVALLNSPNENDFFFTLPFYFCHNCDSKILFVS